MNILELFTINKNFNISKISIKIFKYKFIEKVLIYFKI
jgi:hypothetical protein